MNNILPAIEEIRRGGIVIVVDDDNRENEGDLVMAAEAATTEKIGFFLRHTSGLICAPTTPERCDALGLTAMVAKNQDPHGTAFTVSVDAIAGTTTGISAGDRGRTLRALGTPEMDAKHFARPGHVFPLRARSGGVLKRAGHTEAAVDLTRLANRAPVGVIAEVVSEDRERMAETRELRRLAVAYRLPLLGVGDIVAHRVRTERLVKHVSEGRMEIQHGQFTCHAWRSLTDDLDHVALVYGDVTTDEPVLVRVHSECLTGDVFGSSRCDCGSQLDDAIRAVVAAGRGVIIYLRGQEGRGIGLAHKLAAYGLQDEGHDTVDANLLLGFPVDSREYWAAAQILLELRIKGVRLMTNNPEKIHALTTSGVPVVERVQLPLRITAQNLLYLNTKRRRLGHLLPEQFTEVGAV